MTSLRRPIALLLALSALCAAAAPVYTVPWLGRVAGLAGIVLPDSMGPYVDNDSTWNYRGRALRVRTNAFGDVSHIGYKLFDTRWAADYEARPLLDFLERCALEEDALPDSLKAEATSRKNVTFTRGDATMLKTLTPATPFRIDEQERRAYRVEWGEGDAAVCLTVPADCQALLGANLIELEEMLERDLLRTDASVVPDTLPAAWRDCPVSRAEGLAVADGGMFRLDLIRSRVYLRAEGDGNYRLLADEARHPQQSLNNLLLTGCSRRAVPVRLTLDKYGGIRRPLSVTLPQLVRCFSAAGCRLYLGIKERTETGTSATLFAVHDKLAYCHTLSLIVPAAVLQGEGEIVATLYGFTPIQNVPDKYFTLKP